MMRWLRSSSRRSRVPLYLQLTRRLNAYAYSRLPADIRPTGSRFIERRLNPLATTLQIYGLKTSTFSYTVVTFLRSMPALMPSRHLAIRLLTFTEERDGELLVTQSHVSNGPSHLMRWSFRCRLGPSRLSSQPRQRWLFTALRTDGRTISSATNELWGQIKSALSATLISSPDTQWTDQSWHPLPQRRTTTPPS